MGNWHVGHERTINVLNIYGTSLYNTGDIQDSQISTSYTFVNLVTYMYRAEGDPGVTTEGTITAVDDDFSNTSTNSGNFDTEGVCMVPVQNIDNYLSEITNAGIAIDSRTPDIVDLRGGQSGGEQEIFKH